MGRDDNTMRITDERSSFLRGVSDQSLSAPIAVTIHSMPSTVHVALRPNVSGALRLSTDTLRLVLRFAGASALGRFNSVCSVWRNALHWQKMLSILWCDVTGERLELSSPAPPRTGSIPPVATTPGRKGGGAVDIDTTLGRRLLQSLTLFDRRQIRTYTLRCVSCDVRAHRCL